MSEFKIGQTVETSTHQQGVVKYIGPIHVAEGDWLGIELPTETGKNDGSVRGERYFSCPPNYGLFIRESNISRIVAQPAPKPAPSVSPMKPPPRPKSAAVAPPKSRPSSVVAPRTAPRTSIINKRQSVAPTPTQTTSRAPVRKASIVGSSATSATESTSKPTQPSSRTSTIAPSSASNSRPVRDGAVETLQTKIRHLEKQHADDQERLKELTQARDERDRFHGIIQKLQSKCQTLYQDTVDSKAQIQILQTEKEQLSQSHQSHEIDYEDALVDKEMAEERADQAEAELESLRSKLEEREMELEILRDEAELFTADMSEEERQEAGYYRLQHENDRLREALVALKEMTEEKERDNKARFSELESDLSSLDVIRQENADLQEQLQKTEAVNEHLRAQVDAGAEWEDMSNELTNKNQELEDRITTQDALIRDLESLKELNDELEAQHMDEAEDLFAELAMKDTEIAEQFRRIQDQEAIIADQQILVTKFRELVFDLQGRMADAESMRNMTETQVKDTTGRFNEVMDLNRRLRASNVQATSKEITSELRKIRGDEAVEKLAICAEAESADFGNSEPLRAYFTAKSVAAKASLVASLLANTDRQLSYDGGLDEALSRLLCVEAVHHLTVLEAGSDRLWSAMAVAPLADFTVYGPTHIELLTVEKALDQGLDALKVDEVNFAELAGSFERSTKIQEAILSNRQDALATLPEDETLLRVRNISASLSYLDSNFAVINTMLRFLVTHGSERVTDDETQLASSTDITQQASNVLERFTDPTMKCNKAMLAGQKLLKTVDALRRDALYPRFLGGLENVTQVETLLGKTAHEAAEWGQKALRVVSSSFDSDGKFHMLELDLDNLLRFYWSTEFDQIDLTVARLNGWIEEASVLMNSSEIERGPTPWSQKAKELEAARKKNSEAAVLLENLKAEHKATLLSLHERERVIETKSLEIEHLEAKYRDATNKVADAQQLRDRIVQADQEVIELQKQLRTQQLKIESLEEHVTRSDRSDHAPLVPDASNLATEPVEQPMTSRTLPAQLNSLLSALQTENHWLRQREHADMFDRNLRHIFTKMQPTRQRERVHPGELELWDEWLSDEDEDDVSYVSPSRFPSTHTKDAPEPPSPQRKESRPRMWPLALKPARTGWQASRESAAGAWAGFELSLDKDLSMLGEDFDEDDALDYEDLSELQV